MSGHLFKYLIILSILGSALFIPSQEVSLAAPQAIITVTTLEDEDDSDGDCSLREAIRSAALNNSQDKCEAGSATTDTIIFSVSGTISLTTYLNITDDEELVIDGAGVITISGGDSVKIFSLNSVANLTLEGLTLEDGYDDEGGCISNEGNLEISNSTLLSCSATGNGGAIYNDNTLYIHGSTLSNNSASFSGGGIYNDIYGSLTIDDSNVSDNISGYSGGGIASRSSATINTSTFSGNSTSSSGGGMINSSTLTINGCTISGNSANSGGGIDNTGNLTLNNSTVSNNDVSGDGGGIINDDTLIIIGSTFAGNSAYSGGGIINWDGGTVDISNSTLYDNNADFTGGGVSNHGTLTLLNSTLSGNHANSLGGGIFNDFGSLTIDNSTFNGNGAVLSGGAIDNHGIASVEGSILAGSTSGGNCSGNPVTDDGFNLEDAATCGFLVANDSMANTDPVLGVLQNNGGPSWTYALLPDSPAIDVAGYSLCPATDQRGVPRPLDGDWSGGATCDIGSYEVGLFVLPVSQTDTLSPGTTGDYQFTVYNYTNLTDTYTLTSDAGNWSSDVTPSIIGPIPAGETRTFTLSVTTPLTAKVGSTKTVVAIVTSNTEPTVYAATAPVEIEVGPWHFYLPMIARAE